jgi:hypothetical protein
VKLLFVSRNSRSKGATSTTVAYVRAGRALGHDVSIFSEQKSDSPGECFSCDLTGVDWVIFVVHGPKDLPGLPVLGELLDGIPRSRRVVIDCCGRYNDTVCVEHDSNHLEKLDGHAAWEWIEGLQAISDRILQPTSRPLRGDVQPFLFHGFDPFSIQRAYRSPQEAARVWSGNDGSQKRYGFVYVGNNFQKWSQLRPLMEVLEPLRGKAGAFCLAGQDWNKRPKWAASKELHGVDVDPDVLARFEVEVRPAIPFDEVIPLMGQGRFCPIIHRPLFNQLGLVTTRTFETFSADTIPVLLLPPLMVEDVYGSAALALRADENVSELVTDMLRRPETYWDAVLKTRALLAERHSYDHRFRELLAILKT